MLQVKVNAVKEIIYENVPVPVPGPGEAVLKVKSVGICGSDMHVFEGKNPVAKPPVIQGHEFGGIIKSLNDPGGNSGFKIGQKVAVYPIVNCKKCYYCNKGIENMCSNQKLFAGRTLDGAMKEEIAIPIDNLVSLPEPFDILYAPLIEPAAVSIHAIKGIKKSNILIIGMGTLGIIALQICKYYKNKVIAIDIDNTSLERAEYFGSDLVLNMNNKDWLKTLKEFTGTEKLNYILDCVNNEKTFDLALNYIDKKGKIILLGVPFENFKVDILKILMNELNIEGSYLYSKKEYLMAKNYIIKGIIDVKNMLPEIFPLNKAADAYEYKVKNRSKKVLLIN